MIWVAIEDADKHDATRVRVQDTEDGRHVVYDGVTYRGGFGYNLWVARKYRGV